jgi:hypothetical protein
MKMVHKIFTIGMSSVSCFVSRRRSIISCFPSIIITAQLTCYRSYTRCCEHFKQSTDFLGSFVPANRYGRWTNKTGTLKIYSMLIRLLNCQYICQFLYNMSYQSSLICDKAVHRLYI